MAKIDTPIMFVIFNRLEVTKETFNAIKKEKPSKLYIVSDAARLNKAGEKEKVEAVRRYVEENIDWECEIKKDYAKENLGCRKRISTGVSWVLSQEETVIVLEDDIVPSHDFFQFCNELLALYKDNDRIMMISGNNNIEGHINDSYTFSCFPSCWGWATWKRAWKYYDDDMNEWPEVRKKREMKKIVPGLSYLTLRSYYDYVYRRSLDSWSYAWHFCMCNNQGLGIVPRENLIKNIGFDSLDATHTTGQSQYSFKCGSVIFPLEKKYDADRNIEYDKAYISEVFPANEALGQYILKCILYIPRKIVKYIGFQKG